MKSNANKFIPLGAPSFGKEDISEVIDSLKSGWVGTGPKVSQFEKNFGGEGRIRLEWRGAGHKFQSTRITKITCHSKQHAHYQIVSIIF